jgi:hypothetical protein
MRVSRTVTALAIVAAAGFGAVGTVQSASAAAQPALVSGPTAVTLRTSRAVANYGDPGRITAAVKAVLPARGVPTGTVDFAYDGNYLATYALDAYGRAAMPLTDLYPVVNPGTYQITATYSGDANYTSSTSGAVAQTIAGITTPPVTTLTLNSRGLPVFSPRSFTLSSYGPVGCAVNIVNNTPTAQGLAYGMPGAWKILPFGTLAAGATKGVGVSLANFTGYFTTKANTANYIAIHCH